MSDRRGFTLVELMVAIGLIVLLAASLSSVFRREGSAGMALRVAQRELMTALELARQTAAARQVSVRLTLSVEGQRWWLERAEGETWVGLRESGEFPAGTRAVADGGSVEFRPDGSVVEGVHRITLALVDGPGEPAAVRALIVMADGRIEEGEP